MVGFDARVVLFKEHRDLRAPGPRCKALCCFYAASETRPPLSPSPNGGRVSQPFALRNNDPALPKIGWLTLRLGCHGRGLFAKIGFEKFADMTARHFINRV